MLSVVSSVQQMEVSTNMKRRVLLQILASSWLGAQDLKHSREGAVKAKARNSAPGLFVAEML
jgi:hypothetical protein